MMASCCCRGRNAETEYRAALSGLRRRLRHPGGRASRPRQLGAGGCLCCALAAQAAAYVVARRLPRLSSCRRATRGGSCQPPALPWHDLRSCSHVRTLSCAYSVRQRAEHDWSALAALTGLRCLRLRLTDCVVNSAASLCVSAVSTAPSPHPQPGPHHGGTCPGSSPCHAQTCAATTVCRTRERARVR